MADIDPTLDPELARRHAQLTYADVTARDQIPPPADLAPGGGATLGGRPLAKARYTDPAFHAREVERLWSRVWQMACREEEIADIGDYIVYDLADTSLIVVRSGRDTIKAFHNSCLHRGMQLRASDGCAQSFRCPFHGFTWDLDGRLAHVPLRWDHPHIADAAWSLPEARVETWQGFVFVNLDPEAAPLVDHLGVLPEHFRDWPFGDRFIKGHVRKILPANWKASLEAFLEAYHVWETHSQAIATGGDSATQYDVFGETVSRFLEPLGVPSEMMADPPGEQEILAMMLARSDIPVPTLAPGQTARHVLAAANRAAFSAAHGVDYAAVSDSEAMDSLEYFLFPNLVVFRGLAIPLIYRFRPNGNDPDSCVFDLILIDRVPAGGDRPPPAEPIPLGPEDSIAAAGVLPPWLGEIYDQDTHNLRMLQRGLKAGGRDHVTPSVYQERRIAHFHRTLDRWLGDRVAVRDQGEPRPTIDDG